MQLCGFHCISGYSISAFYSNFIHFTCLRVVYREFLWLRFTKCGLFQLFQLAELPFSTEWYILCHFSHFGHLTQNWVQFIISAQWRLRLPDSAVSKETADSPYIFVNILLVISPTGALLLINCNIPLKEHSTRTVNLF